MDKIDSAFWNTRDAATKVAMLKEKINELVDMVNDLTVVAISNAALITPEEITDAIEAIVDSSGMVDLEEISISKEEEKKKYVQTKSRGGKKNA